MLDINRIKENQEEVKAALAKRNYSVDFSGVILLDDKRKAFIFET